MSFFAWPEAYQAGPTVCGGKGYNLARLVRYGFRVPRGGVLPVGAPLSAIPAFEGKVAVRSSATAEDSARASFAGIHRSFLNVSTEGVQQAAQGCIDSLQTPEAIAYRRIVVPAMLGEVGMLGIKEMESRERQIGSANHLAL